MPSDSGKPETRGPNFAKRDTVNLFRNSSLSTTEHASTLLRIIT